MDDNEVCFAATKDFATGVDGDLRFQKGKKVFSILPYQARTQPCVRGETKFTEVCERGRGGGAVKNNFEGVKAQKGVKSTLK